MPRYIGIAALFDSPAPPGGLSLRTGFEQEAVAGDSLVVGKAEMAVIHPPEQEGVVIGEFEGFCGAVGVLDLELELDGGAHGSAVCRYFLQVWAMEEKVESRRSDSRRSEEEKGF